MAELSSCFQHLARAPAATPSLPKEPGGLCPADLFCPNFR